MSQSIDFRSALRKERVGVHTKMELYLRKIGNQKIFFATVAGDLVGSGALDLQERLSAFLEKDRPFLLINLKKTKRIDGLGINILDNIFSKSKYVRLFNVSQEVRMMFVISGKDLFLRCTYNETDSEKAVLLFGKEFFRSNNKVVTNNRRFPRVATLIPTTFTYYPGYNGVITGMANIFNLSEGGIMVGNIMVIHTQSGKIVEQPELVGLELYDLEFTLQENLQTIKTKGKCLWEAKENNQFRLGVRFTEIGRNDQVKIRAYAFCTSLKEAKEKGL
ncbi:MAG: PilZ domain-containing protein [Candidatus Brocadiaceae bacterium]|nr:PilZ domain-containing protein [Candidatus Brocadiaceae bacterium]